MANFWAVRPHDAGMFSAEDIPITGETREEVLTRARAGMIGGRYLSRIVAEDGRTTLWNESGGWTDAAKAVLPR
jgi:hypothetical protein